MEGGAGERRRRHREKQIQLGSAFPKYTPLQRCHGAPAKESPFCGGCGMYEGLSLKLLVSRRTPKRCRHCCMSSIKQQKKAQQHTSPRSTRNVTTFGYLPINSKAIECFVPHTFVEPPTSGTRIHEEKRFFVRICRARKSQLPQ